MGENRGSIAFFATYRPPLPLDLFSCPISPSSEEDEVHLTDGESYNYNGQSIPPAALKAILKRPKLASAATEDDVDSGRLTGFIFVSERDHSLETLHIALRFNTSPPEVKVFSLADVFGSDTFNGVRMEDSGCIAGGYPYGNTRHGYKIVDHSFIYVSTKDPVEVRRSPWTVVYKTNFSTGKTERLTPQGTSDLSPSVSPSGKKVAVASFEGKGWNGEIEDLQTDIYVMNVENSQLGLERKRLVENGGWPTWGSETVIFFHRKVGNVWGVFCHDITTGKTIRVTPVEFSAVTPAAISETQVAVAILPDEVKQLANRQLSKERTIKQYRHIKIFDTKTPNEFREVTQNIKQKADYFNPFVIDGAKGKRVGCCASKKKRRRKHH